MLLYKVRSYLPTTAAVLLGIMALANGLAMIIVPLQWYWTIPGATAHGPFNQHFIKDIGLIYLLIGLAFLCGCFFKKHSTTLWIMPSLWLLGHAFFHLSHALTEPTSILTGVIDFTGVMLPALLSLYLVTLRSWLYQKN